MARKATEGEKKSRGEKEGMPSTSSLHTGEDIQHQGGIPARGRVDRGGSNAGKGGAAGASPYLFSRESNDTKRQMTTHVGSLTGETAIGKPVAHNAPRKGKK